MDVTALLEVGGVAVLIYGATHVVQVKNEITNIKKDLNGTALQADLDALEKAAKAEVAEVRSWFDHTAPTKPAIVDTPINTAQPKVVAIPATTPVVPVDAPMTPFVKSAADVSNDEKIKSWLAPAIDWTKVSATELTVIYKQQIAGLGVTTYLNPDGTTTTNPVGGVASPNFVIQGKVIRGLLTTETERAYVGYNNADGIGVHFLTAFDGTTIPR